MNLFVTRSHNLKTCHVICTTHKNFVGFGRRPRKATKNDIKIRRKDILVAIENGEASQNSLSPFQSVMTPPAPSITGTSARKSYG